jgi:glutamine amidotransferase
MKNLHDSGILPVLEKKVMQYKTPVLGICLGMQLFSKKSEEGTRDGLGWIDAQTVIFRFEDSTIRLKIPHMGWNHIKPAKPNPIFDEMDESSRFYFVHSYHVVCNKPEDILATTVYGYEFVSAVNRGNIYGVQFHPEKSHKFGMKLLKNFVERA